MSILLKNVRILDPHSPAHGKQANILIEKGVISSLDGKKAKNTFDLSGKFASPGWMDVNAHFNDPGTEHREDVETGAKTAQAGGFTDVCLIPHTTPPIESKSDINYLIKKAPGFIDIHVIGALSEGLNGDNLTEILDLYHAGAIAFSDGDNVIWNAELMLKALQYTGDIDVPVIQNARDRNISRNTHMHEGAVSTHLGLRAEPSLSEELIIQRDLDVQRYGGGKIHFTRVSTARGVDLIKKAKKEGLKVTCDVSIYHLLFTDASVGDFDTTFKNLPPYRTEKDRKALIKALKEGTIDAICSNHRPLDQEAKQLEFDLADPGSTSLQTFYPALLQLSKELPIDTLIEKLVNGPRMVFNMSPICIKEGQLAKLTLMDPDASWTLDNQTNLSKSRNSPFWNKSLKGKIIGTVNGEESIIEG